MKITYDLTKNVFKNINILLGIYQQKKQLIKNPNKKILKGTTQALILLSATILSLILFGIVIYTKQKQLENLSYFIFVFLILYTLYYYIILFTTYFEYKKEFSNGTIILNQDGIEDICENGSKILIPWNKIELIVIKDNLLTICTQVATLTMIAPIEDKDITKLITTCKKYNEEILIINKMEK